MELPLKENSQIGFIKQEVPSASETAFSKKSNREQSY
jgi:hypothetical protein